jgi:hypothetical protein
VGRRKKFQELLLRAKLVHKDEAMEIVERNE